MRNQGSSKWDPVLRGDQKSSKLMVILKDFPGNNSALFRLVSYIYNDPWKSQNHLKCQEVAGWRKMSHPGSDDAPA